MCARTHATTRDGRDSRDSRDRDFVAISSRFRRDDRREIANLRGRSDDRRRGGDRTRGGVDDRTFGRLDDGWNDGWNDE